MEIIMSLNDFETACDHYAQSFGSFLKGLVHTVAVVAPYVAQIAPLIPGATNVGNVANTISNVATSLDKINEGQK